MRDNSTEVSQIEIKAYSTRFQNRHVACGSLDWINSGILANDARTFLALDDAKMRDLQISEQTAHDSLVRIARSSNAEDILNQLFSASAQGSGKADHALRLRHFINSLSTLHYEDAAFPLFQLPSSWLIKTNHSRTPSEAAFPVLFQSVDGVPSVLLDASLGFRETSLILQKVFVDVAISFAISMNLTQPKDELAKPFLDLARTVTPRG